MNDIIDTKKATSNGIEVRPGVYVRVDVKSDEVNTKRVCIEVEC